MRQCKDHMKVRSIHDFCSAFVNPDFFRNCLTVGTVAIFAGVVVDLYMATIGTLVYIVSKISSFAVYYRTRCLILYLGTQRVFFAKCIIRKIPDLLYLRIIHVQHLPSCREDLPRQKMRWMPGEHRWSWNSKIYVQEWL